MYTLTRTPEKAQLNDADNELFLAVYLDSDIVGYDSPTDTTHGSFIIPTVVTCDRHGDGVEILVKRRSGKLSKNNSLAVSLNTVCATTCSHSHTRCRHGSSAPRLVALLLDVLPEPVQRHLNPKKGVCWFDASHRVCYTTH